MATLRETSAPQPQPWDNVFVPPTDEQRTRGSLDTEEDPFHLDEPARYETVNEHGHPQMVEEGVGDVCCSCLVTYTNRGNGMACPTCQSEFMAECLHDDH